MSRFNVLRANSTLLISLMLSWNPELREAEDIRWLEEKLMLGKSDAEASEHLRGEYRRPCAPK